MSTYREQFVVTAKPGPTGRVRVQLPTNNGQTLIYQLSLLSFECLHIWNNIVTGLNDVLSFSLNDTVYSVTLPPAEYTLSEMITALNALIVTEGFNMVIARSGFTCSLTSTSTSFFVLPTTLSRQLGFTDGENNSAVSNLTFTAPYEYDVRLSSLFPSIVITNSALQRVTSVHYGRTESTLKVWENVPLGCTPHGRQIIFRNADMTPEGLSIQPNTSSFWIEFYWSNGSPVNFGNHSIHLTYQTINT